MNTCPCCHHTLLRHAGHHRVYWFCRNCWQEMPLLDPKQSEFILPKLEQKPLLSLHRPLTFL